MFSRIGPLGVEVLLRTGEWVTIDTLMRMQMRGDNPVLASQYDGPFLVNDGQDSWMMNPHSQFQETPPAPGITRNGEYRRRSHSPLRATKKDIRHILNPTEIDAFLDAKNIVAELEGLFSKTNAKNSPKKDLS